MESKTFTAGIMITTGFADDKNCIAVWNVVPGRRKLGHDFQVVVQAKDEYDAIEQARAILNANTESEAA